MSLKTKVNITQREGAFKMILERDGKFFCLGDVVEYNINVTAPNHNVVTVKFIAQDTKLDFEV
jgi:hypothetical protein